MIININDVEILMGLAEEMYASGYKHAAYPVDQISDESTIEFFKNQ